MKKAALNFFLLILGVYLSGFLLAQEFEMSPESKMLLNLQQSLERALANNPRILQAKQEMNIAQTNVSQARSLFFPHMDFSLNYARYRNETLGVTSPDLGLAVLEPSPAPSGSRDDFSQANLYLGRLGFKQTLYAGGRLDSTFELSKANLERSEIYYESLKREVEYKVKESFYSLLSSKLKKDLMDAALADLKGIADKVQGIRDRMALIRAKSEIRERTADLSKEEKQQRFNYLQVVGLELFSDAEITGNVEASVPELKLEQALAWAKQNRNELKETLLAEEVDRLSVNLAMSEKYPVVLLGGAYELRDQDLTMGQRNWNAVLSMNIPVFDGFSGLARIKESRFKAKEGRYRRVQLEDQIEKEVRSAFDDLVYWQEELINRKDDLASLSAAMNKSPGVVPAYDRIDFVKWKLDSSLKVADAKLSLILAQSRLEYAVGRAVSP